MPSSSAIGTHTEERTPRRRELVRFGMSSTSKDFPLAKTHPDALAG
jgi:propanediol dehydratase small subunit